MKINPIGISTYQQVSRTGKAGQPANATNQNTPAAKLTVQPQNSSDPSRVSLKPRAFDGITAMTKPERNALENLLKVIHEKGFQGAGYARDNRVVDNPDAVGTFIDVKV